MRRRATKTGALVLALLVSAGAAISTAAVIQSEGLRITLLSQIMPYKLPRIGTSPIAVFISGHVATVDGAVPPQLQTMTVKVNRHGLLQSKGLPVCHTARDPARLDRKSARDCGRRPGRLRALLGLGRLPRPAPLPDPGPALGLQRPRAGQPVLFAHIFTTQPFASSFVVAFALKHIPQGPYGTELSASLPQALGNWGFVDRIKLTLRRKYRYRGRELSYFNAACPAPKGATAASFPLATANFSFAGGEQIAVTVPKACRVKE